MRFESSTSTKNPRIPAPRPFEDHQPQIDANNSEQTARSQSRPRPAAAGRHAPELLGLASEAALHGPRPALLNSRTPELLNYHLLPAIREGLYAV
jgi:hypothetical protein